MDDPNPPNDEMNRFLRFLHSNDADSVNFRKLIAESMLLEIGDIEKVEEIISDKQRGQQRYELLLMIFLSAERHHYWPISTTDVESEPSLSASSSDEEVANVAAVAAVGMPDIAIDANAAASMSSSSQDISTDLDDNGPKKRSRPSSADAHVASRGGADDDNANDSGDKNKKRSKPSPSNDGIESTSTAHQDDDNASDSAELKKKSELSSDDNALSAASTSTSVQQETGVKENGGDDEEENVKSPSVVDDDDDDPLVSPARQSKDNEDEGPTEKK